jgi:hypothetical protein
MSCDLWLDQSPLGENLAHMRKGLPRGIRSGIFDVKQIQFAAGGETEPQGMAESHRTLRREIRSVRNSG